MVLFDTSNNIPADTTGVLQQESLSTATPATEDPFLTLIPNQVLTTRTTSDNDKYSLKYLPLPSRLAYPFWYDPHPLAKWAADQLKNELPIYDANAKPTIALGKMYGVLVVSLGEDNSTSDDVPKLGYLKAYSGTMPRPQYGGSVIPSELEESFVPLVYDRFKEGNGDDEFNYEREEEILNGLTREIERLESCTKRKKDIEEWKENEAALQQQLSDLRQKQKVSKRDRKTRRKNFRKKQKNNNNSNINNMSEKEEHKYFLENNDDYRKLEEQLVQESAFDQRQFKALKVKIDAELQKVQKAINNYQSEIDSLKQRRKEGSINLQRNLFEQYKLLNVSGQTKTPVEIFKETILKVPPSGTGDCAAIKLFQHAFSKGYQPVALAEFWWGPSPLDLARTHGNYYPCCRGKCEPILTRHMLLGIDVESDPLTEELLVSQESRELSIVYEDEWLVIVNKPHDVLSVPGRIVQDSIQKDLQQRYTNETLLVHRLDYSTSGLLLAAKDSNTHKELQAQFIDRSVEKRYEALLEGDLNDISAKGKIDLPLAGDYYHRPMQKVERGPEGKSAVTFYEIVENVTTQDNRMRTRVYFYPKTGRTHQLRVHASHPEGLGIAIVGDDIYGQRDKRLCLHAGLLKIFHPHKKEHITLQAPAPF